MKKDIQIPQVEGVRIAVVLEYNEIFKSDDWNVYIVNENNYDLDLVMIASKGFSKTKETSVMRHKIEMLSANSFAKVELMLEDVLSLTNEFNVSYFYEENLYDKTFTFKEDTICKGALLDLDFIKLKGIFAI